MDKRIIEETPSTEVLNDDWLIKDSPTGGTSKILGSKLKEIISGDVEDSIDKILSSIAPEWSPTFTYGFDAYVIYEGKLWRCFKDTGSTVGEFKTNEWIKAVTSGYITHVVNKIADRFVASNPPFMTYRYSVGDMVFYSEPYHDDQLYVCNTDLPQGESTFNPEHWDVVYTVAGLSKYLMDKIAEAGQIDDVQVKTTGDYESVVDENKVAKIDLSNILIEKSVPNLPQPIASFSDGSDNPLKSLTASIVPVQDLHGYDSPWAGGAGKNKCPQLITEFTYSANAGGSYIISDGVLAVSVTSTNNSGVYTTPSFVETYSQVCSYSMDIKADTNMNTLVGFTNFGRKEISLTNQWQRVTFDNVTFDGSTPTLVVYGRGTAGTISVKNFMFELGSVSHDFAPYSNICPISGWSGTKIVNMSDITNIAYFKGLLDGTYGFIDLGSEIWNKESNFFRCNPNNMPMVDGINFIISRDYVPGNPYASENDDIYLVYNQNDVGHIIIRDLDYTDATAFKTAMNGAYIIYKLATPTTPTITPQQFNTLLEAFNIDGLMVTIPFTDSQGNPVEVYGGSVDVVNGSLTEDVKFYDDLKNVVFELSANGQYYWSRSSTIPYALSQSDGMCSHFKFSSSGDVFCGTSDATGHYILFYKSKIDSALGISSVAEFNTWLANQSTNGTPVQLWYKLATPNAPIQQQPTSIKSLDGENNVGASTGDVTKLDYIANATDVIANLEARVTALENQ